jgi:hypothetical protein
MLLLARFSVKKTRYKITTFKDQVELIWRAACQGGVRVCVRELTSR